MLPQHQIHLVDNPRHWCLRHREVFKAVNPLQTSLGAPCWLVGKVSGIVSDFMVTYAASMIVSGWYWLIVMVDRIDLPVLCWYLSIVLRYTILRLICRQPDKSDLFYNGPIWWYALALTYYLIVVQYPCVCRVVFIWRAGYWSISSVHVTFPLFILPMWLHTAK